MTIDFIGLPKQWLVCRENPGPVTGAGPVVEVLGLWIIRAPSVPVITITQSGQTVAALIGWVIHDGQLHLTDATLDLSAQTTVAQLFAGLGGRFVMLWQDEGRLTLREDATGNLPACFHGASGMVASTPAALARAVALTPDADVEALFEFPKRRGFFPFGLSPWQGVRRVQPNHALDLDTMACHRIWPRITPDRIAETDAAAIATAIAGVADHVAGQIRAITNAQSRTVLYLSGGYDSRMVLAAATGLEDRLRLQTLDTKGGQDIHLAKRLARLVGQPLELIPVSKAPPEDVEAWVTRTGRMIYDHVTDATATMVQNAPPGHPLSGTGADLLRGHKLILSDLGATGITRQTLLSRILFEDVPVLRDAADHWLDNLPDGADRALTMDLVAIEQLIGGWAGIAMYGHDLPVPTLHPFNGAVLTDTLTRLPVEYRLNGGPFRDFVQGLSPDLLSLPVNRAVGLHRLRFWKDELKRITPTRIKRMIRPGR